MESYSRDDLRLFNVLARPIWVFDIENKAMWYANVAALKLWGADSLESLLARDFASDMSKATEKRINSFLERFKKGERVSDQWTYYPGGRAVTVELQLSGIYCDGRLLMLNEGDMPKAKEEIDQMAIRRSEILHHLPLAVAQFDSEGHVVEQNPQSMDVFGGSNSCGPGFLSRFVDTNLGQRTLEKVLGSDETHLVEAELHTAKDGARWFAVKARRSRDPVTSAFGILYSASDITERRQAKKEADQAALEKSEFLAVISHEIRTPLHQVNGFIELLEHTPLNKQQAEYVAFFLNGSAQCLMAIINDLLDYTKLEAGKMVLESIPLDVSAVVAGSLATIGPQVERNGLELIRSMCTKVPDMVVGDPTRLRQVLLNLLSNAVKFTHEGEISLCVKTLDNDSFGRIVLRFEVRDTGIGIRSEHRYSIFRKYQQADASTSRKYGGTGLGLAICKLIVEAMGGEIGVDSTLGQGSVFWIQLPFQQLSTASKSNIGVECHPASELRGLNVLVAEDNIVNQKLVAALLKRLNHTSKIVENGLAAVQELEASSPQYDLVLMDVMMPTMDGMEATKKIRELGIGQLQLPIVGLTADFRKEDIEKYKRVGMNDCIGKPVRLATLRNVLYDAMKASSKGTVSPAGDLAGLKMSLHDAITASVTGSLTGE